MTEFLKYTHIERIGTTEVDGILEGRCYVFPKIDGTNGSVWLADGKLQAGSRNRHLSLDADNAGFLAAMLEDKAINTFFQSHPDKRLFGEWLVPHSLKTYADSAWRKFYVFDVLQGEKHLSYEDYAPLLEEHGIEYVPPIFIVENPREERLFSALEQNNFLIKDGEGSGEGIVIKNYSFINRFGRPAFAKLVTAEFKAKHVKALGPREIKEKARVEDAIAAQFVTKSMVDKVYAKIVNETGGFSSRDIPRLLNTVFYDIIREETWEILKAHKNPTIDFSILMKAVFAHTKVYKPEIFGIAPVAQLAEQSTCNAEVACSTPAGGTIETAAA